MNTEDSLNNYKNDSFHILEIINEPFAIINKDYTYRYVNKAHEKFYNLSKKDIIGIHIKDLTDNHFFTKKIKPFFDACLNGEKVKFINHQIKKNNLVYAYEIEYYPLRNDIGEIEGVVSSYRNITESIELKEQLINSKQKWSNSVNALADILMIINTNFEIEDINEAGLKLINKSRYEVLGKKCYQILKGTYKESECSNCIIKNNKEAQQYEWYNDNNKRYYEVKTAPIKNNKGETIKYIDLLHDITELKQKEIELIESKERFKSLFRNSLDGILYIDIEGNILEANDKLLKILGSPSLEETKKINVFEYKPLIDMGYAADMKKCIITGKSIFGKNTYESKWGKNLHVRYYFNPIRKDGRIIGVLANLEDKTDEYNANLQKQLSDEKYRILAQNATDIIIIINYNFDIIYVSPSCELLTGFTPDEFLKLKGYDIIYNRDIEFAYQMGRKIMRGESKRNDIRINKKNGKQLWVDTEGKSIKYNNQDCILLTARNISERKQFEDKIQNQNSELKQLNKTKDKIFSIISHDLKNPLNNILGFSKLLMSNKKLNLDEKAFSFINHIHQAADRLHFILDNLLNWSRTQIGSIQYMAKPYNLYNVAHETIMSANILAHTKEIKIENKIPENTIAYFDKTLISVVLMNLLTNAIKFSHEHCFITLRSQFKNQMIEVCVEDHGVGIDKKNIDKLFSNENFTTPGTNNEAGTGLGLGIVKEFIELNKGEIWVESKKKMGSKFYFTLPLKEDLK
jgi:PAS domain S-box-containing protein